MFEISEHFAKAAIACAGCEDCGACFVTNTGIVKLPRLFRTMMAAGSFFLSLAMDHETGKRLTWQQQLALANGTVKS